MPAEDREKIADFDFGIEDTRNNGDSELVDILFTGGSIGDPNDVITKEDAKKKKTTSSTSTESTTKAVEKKEDNIDKSLLDSLLEDKDDDDTSSTTTDSTTVAPASKQDNEPSTFASLINDFYTLGVFQKDEDEEEIKPDLSGEEFTAWFEHKKNGEINNTINSFLGRFGEDYRDMFNAVFVKGVDPQSYLQTFVKLQNFAGLDMTVEANQQKVYEEFYRRQGFPEDKIEAKVAKAKANGDLEDESTQFHQILVQNEATELETKAAETEKKKLEDKRIKQLFVQNANKVLVDKLKEKEYDGIPLTEQIAREALDFVTNEKYVLPTGEGLTEFDKFILELKRPENHALKVKIALLAKNGFDLSKIKMKEKNEATKQAFQWAVKGKEEKSKNNQQQQVKKEADSFI